MRVGFQCALFQGKISPFIEGRLAYCIPRHCSYFSHRPCLKELESSPTLHSQVIDFLFSYLSSLLTHPDLCIMLYKGSDLGIRLSNDLGVIFDIVQRLRIKATTAVTANPKRNKLAL